MRNSLLESVREKTLNSEIKLNVEASFSYGYDHQGWEAWVAFKKPYGPSLPVLECHMLDGLSSLIPDEFFLEKTRALRKMASARKILTILALQYADLWKDQAWASKNSFFEKEHLLSSRLVHLIAATDGNEDSVGHSQLVAQYAVVLARAMGIVERSELVNIRHGALLHDIGKIGIPEKILRKPASLTPEEMEVIKEHPLLGYEIIHDCEFLKKAARVVLFHHERYDGTGYPYGLTNEEIPLEARIFAVADTLDAITSDRPYRKGQSFQTALSEMEKQSGAQFDPKVVRTFLEVPETTWLQIRETERPLRTWTVH